jgi:sugar lactone lactonase YvrE
MSDMTVFAQGLHLAEAPRWHDDRLWVSDMWDHKVWCFGVDGDRALVHDFGPQEDPGGLGWLPDGSLLVVGMEGRCLYRLAARSPGHGAAQQPELYADLRGVAPWQCNDLEVAPDGTAYVSQFGWDMWGRSGPHALTTVIRVNPDRQVDTVADMMASPNGMSIRDAGRVLVVAESGASQLTRFTITGDGRLADRAVFAKIPAAEGLGMAPPDGICSDAQGAIWVAEPIGRRVLRIEAGGALSERIDFEEHPLAVCLGGADGRTLFVCVTGQHVKPQRDPRPMATIVTMRVAVPRAT